MAIQVSHNDAQFKAFTQFAASVSDNHVVLKVDVNPPEQPNCIHMPGIGEE